jgi:hypothetical protein
MKVALAPHYRARMLALLPTTLGVGTAALWWRSLNWPLHIDADGLTLRCHRRLPWSSISRIGISRSYLDGHLAELRIHHRRGVSQVWVRGLRNGEDVARVILAMFKRTRAAAGGVDACAVEPAADITRFADGDPLRIKDAPALAPGRDALMKTTLMKTTMEMTNEDSRPRHDSSRDERVGRIPRRAVG